MKKTISTILCSILIASAFSSCGTDKASPEDIYGTWNHSETEYDSTMTFNSDNTYHKDMVSKGVVDVPIEESGTYTFDGETLTMTSDKWGTKTVYKASFKDQEMIWDTGEVQIIYNKK